MNRSKAIAPGLAVAIALSAGGVLLDYPPYTDSAAPGARSDITIAEADNQKIPPESADKNAPSVQTSNPTEPMAGDIPPAIQTTPGEESKGIPPREP